MKILLWLLLSLPLYASNEVHVTHLANDRGQVRLLIFQKKKGFPAHSQHALYKFTLPAKNAKKGILTFHLPKISPGKYALVALHDENSDEQLARSFFGIPEEGVAVSNGPPKGPPKFKKCLVSLPKHPLSLTMKYWKK